MSNCKCNRAARTRQAGARPSQSHMAATAEAGASRRNAGEAVEAGGASGDSKGIQDRADELMGADGGRDL